MNSTSFPLPVTSKTTWLDQLTNHMRRQPQAVPLGIALGLALLLGWVDSITSWELSAFVFYGAPVLLSAWWVGPKAGQLVAAISAGLWWLANRNSHPYETFLGYSWATASRWIFFMLVSWSVHSVRKRREADANQIRLLRERRQLEHDIVAASEHEQQRIGQDLHDGLCQQLAAIGCAQHLLTRDLQMQGNLLSADSALIEEALQAAVVDTRNLARGIFPVHVDGHGLSAALADLALVTSKLTNARILFQEGASVDVLTPEASMHCYRIAQEAVSNSLRRGRASRISISLERSQGKLTLRIEDNGCGFPPTKSGPELGMGLKTMQYRALAMKADLVIDSPPTGGTSVSCIIPISIAENPS